eukprot:jgi/Hompol1/4347/HPOL_007060-RA
MRRGFRKPLVEEDLPLLSNNDKAASWAGRFDNFVVQLRAHAANPAKAKPPSVAWTLIAAFFNLFLASLLCQACIVALAIIRPLMVPQIIAVLTNDSTATGLLTTNAYALAAVLFAMQLANAILWRIESVRLNDLELALEHACGHGR